MLQESLFSSVDRSKAHGTSGGADDGVYPEIVAPEQFVFMRAALHKEGDPPLEVLGTVTFAEQGGSQETKVVDARH